ncbi:MAG: MBL fold metallo-hydrolase [Eubacteriales bacterium]|nr:MBL fold metallo-hydrolase [Eubacteriales bacterium]
MRLIDFFGKTVKPYKLRGCGIFHTRSTGKVDDNIYSLAQWDVNYYAFQKGTDVILIDSGYDNYPHPERNEAKIGLEPDWVKAVFLTHADMDHAGGVIDTNNRFKNATVYIHEKERDMLSGVEKRFKKGPFGFKNPIRRTSGYKLLKDHDVVLVGEIKVQLIHTPGHTYGHSAYIVEDRVLFTGDAIAVNEKGGYEFLIFFKT